MKKYIYISLFLFLNLLLTACDFHQKRASAEQFVQQVKSQARNVSNQPETPFDLPKPVAYRAAIAKVQAGIAKSVSQNPLQATSVKALSFVGVVQTGNTLHAYIQTPDNSIHEVKEGDVIGDTYAKIKSISSDRIVVIEKVVAPDKTVTEHEQIISIKG